MSDGQEMSKGALIGRIVALDRQVKELSARLGMFHAIMCDCPHCAGLYAAELVRLQELEEQEDEHE